MDVQLPTGQILRGVPEGTTKAQLAEKLKSNGMDVPQEWLAPPPEPVPTQGGLGGFNPMLSRLGGAAVKVGEGLGMTPENVSNPIANAMAPLETAMTMGSSLVSQPLSGLGGLIASPFGKGPQAVEAIQSALTYQPRTGAGSAMTKAVAAPFEQMAKVADAAGGATTDATGSPLLGTAANTTLQAIPMLLGAKGARGIKPKAPAVERIAGETPRERAKNYVDSRTSLLWDRLSGDFRRRLEEVAATGTNLERLDAAAIERQGKLASLEVPINNPTRGQVTRDPLQQRTEQLAKSTEAGSPLRELDLAHNKALIENLETLRSRTGATASGDLQTGKSVQTALRGKLALANSKVRKLYDDAEAAGELQGPVNIDKLVEHLKTHDDPSQVSYAMNRLKQLGAITEEANGGITVSSNTPLTLKQLEGIRRAAVAAGKNGGTAGHYASELKRVIDDVTDGAGGEKYQAARAARKSVGDEFERQAAVARLVKNRKMSSDRATALEDTWHKTVMTGSLEDLQAVRKSLGDSPGGLQAWNDLKAATVDYIKDRATGGKLGLKNEAGDSHSTWAGLKRAVDDIGPDKLREIFGEADAKRIETLVDAAQILKTEAPMEVKGSPTVDKILTFLDKTASVPGLGKASELVGGAVKGVQKLGEIGKTGRDIRKAQSTPLDDAKK